MKASLGRFRQFLASHSRVRSRQPVEAKAMLARKYSGAWQSEEIPRLQWLLVEEQLGRLESGDETPEFSTFLRAVTYATEVKGVAPRNLLEIGCSSGYYRQVLHSRFPETKYTGIDFSSSFVEFGLKKFPGIDLRIGDTTNLNVLPQSFDAVVSGSVLLHVFEWRRGLSESCRAAKDVLVLHRTPVSSGPTTLFTKTAYGQKMIEWTFNEQELLMCCAEHNFVLGTQWPVYQNGILGSDASNPTQFTYVLVRSS